MSITSDLKSSILTKDMTEAEIELLAAIGAYRNFYKNEVIFKEQDPCDALFILVEGRVFIEGHVVANRHNIPRQIQTVKRGQIFGEMAFVEGGQRSATARAKGNVVVIALDAKKLGELMDSNHLLGLKMMRNFAYILSRRLRRMNDQWLSAVGRDIILPEFEYY